MFGNVNQNLRYAIRQLRRSLGFTVTAVLTLALGIGAATTMFSILHATLLAPLPFPQPDSLVGVGFGVSGTPPNAEQTGHSAAFLSAHANSFSISGIADDGPLGQSFSSGEGASRAVRSLRVSAGYLPTLGVAPLLGRMFSPQEDVPGAASVAILSEGLWRSALNADPNAAGRVVHINARPYTVIGVMPSAFTTVDSPDLWQPLQLTPASAGYHGDNFQFIARLRAGLTPAQANVGLEPLSRALYRDYPQYRDWNGAGDQPMQESVWPLQRVLVEDARPSVVSLAAAVLTVLLIACLNLAALVSARSARRQSEIALRNALGASYGSVLRLLLAESLLLALGGIGLGLAFARLAIPLLLTAAPIHLPLLRHAGIDVATAMVSLAIGGAAMLLFGLLPALGLLRHSFSGLASVSRTAGSTPSQQRLGRVLVVSQVALATALLSAGALLLGTFLQLRSVPTGVRTDQLYLLQTDLKGDRYASTAQTNSFINAVEDRLRAIPGVVHVAAANGVPLDRGLNMGGYPAGRKDLSRNIEVRLVTPGYFQTAGTPILSGMDFTASDTANSQPIVLISQRMAQLWWPGRSPIGEFVVDGDNPPRRITGVVSDARSGSLAESARPTLYVPYTQIDDEDLKAINGWFPTTFLLRSAPNSAPSLAAGLAKAAAAAVASVDPDVAVVRCVPMQSLLDDAVAPPRFYSQLAGAFAIFALLLTVIGLFGLLSYQVTSRTREWGIRMALGSTRRRVVSLVVGRGMILTGIGVVLGTLLNALLHNLVAAFIADAAQASVTDLSSLAFSQTSAAVLAAVALLTAAFAAGLVPAHRAASIDPNQALRPE